MTLGLTPWMTLDPLDDLRFLIHYVEDQPAPAHPAPEAHSVPLPDCCHGGEASVPVSRFCYEISTKDRITRAAVKNRGRFGEKIDFSSGISLTFERDFVDFGWGSLDDHHLWHK